ncbi:hypothetical protein KSP40_PGU001226 [Platanthera guangdongensis]|uniref:F-box/LRR-repeat protein 15-like leucin rich repeat domain-containing protein n=1 Tax=Platanthera guangdongensis TaxID=2320717 RepID=A0ABR2MQH7_9ASPA
MVFASPTTDDIAALRAQLHQLQKVVRRSSGSVDSVFQEGILRLSHSSHWIVDSGATNHLSAQQPPKYLDIAYPQHITVVNGDRILVSGAAHLPLTTLSLSSDRLIQKIVGRGRLSNVLYLLDVPLTALTTVSTIDWHRRLGHAPLPTLKKALPTVSLQVFFCESCIFSKQHRVSFSPSCTRSDAPLSLVHSDVWGPYKSLDVPLPSSPFVSSGLVSESKEPHSGHTDIHFATDTSIVVPSVFDVSFRLSITDTGMVALGNALPYLQSLDVSNCRNLTDKGLVALAKRCRNLQSLQISGCRFITDELLQAISQNCSRLRELEVAGCFKITDSGIIRLLDGCREIKHLDVSKCGKIGDPGVSRIAETCSTSLKLLKLQDCCNVGGKSIFSLAESCCNLETLVIGGCRYIPDESVKSLAQSCCGSLRILRMSWCSNITDSTLKCIFSNCRYLRALDIESCEKITDSAFEGLAGGCSATNLKALKVANLPGITVAAVGIILEFCRSLEHLDLRSCAHITKLDCQQAGLVFLDSCRVNFVGSLGESDAIVDLFF